MAVFCGSLNLPIRKCTTINLVSFNCLSDITLLLCSPCWSFQNTYEFLYSMESASSFLQLFFCSQALTMKLLGHYSLKIFPYSTQILFILTEAYESGCTTVLMSTVSHATGSCVSCVWLWHVWINLRTAVEIFSEKLFFTQIILL